MASLRELKRRIVSVKNNQKITRAMKLVAAAKLRKAQIAIVQNRPYFEKLQEVIESVAARVRDSQDPLLRREALGKPVHLIVVTSDKGLCGALNANVIKEAVRFLRGQRKDQSVELTLIGKKADQFFRRRPWTIRQSTPMISDMSPESASKILEALIEDFENGKADAVYAIYSEFLSIVSQKPRVAQLLPVKKQEVPPGKILSDYTYEPEQDVILHQVLRQNLGQQGYRMLLEATASEHGARMSAMDSATRNARDLIEQLTLARNRARQEAITKELIEIVSGAAALTE